LKKRIAIIIPGGIGGGYFLQGIPVVEDLVIRLAENFNVTVYSLIKTDPAYLPKNFKLRHTSATLSHPFLWRIFLCSLLLIKDHFKKRYQLVHGIWGYPPGIIAVMFGKIFRVPSVVSIRGGEAANVPEIAYGNMRKRLLRKVTIFTCNHAGALVTLTMFQVNELKKYGYKQPGFQIIPNGVDDTVFRMEAKPLEPPFHFIHIANLNPVKDQGTILKAFKLMAEKADCRLRIIGDGECMDALKKQAQELGIADKVLFTGAVQNKALPAHLHWAHIMLHSSLYEGQGVVLAEAAASGVVICGTNVGLIADWGNNCCIPVACRDFESMAREVLALLNNPERFKELQQNALAWAKNNTAAHMAGSFENLYNSLLK